MRKCLCAVLAIIMALSAAPALAQAPAPLWINSGVIGNVTADTPTNLKDDFHLAINKDWLVNTPVPEGEMMVNSASGLANAVRDQIRALIIGGEQPSHDGKLVQKLYRDYTDMDARNALGMSPAMPFIDEIRGIGTIEELTQYALRDDQFINELFGCEVTTDYANSSINSVFLKAPDFALGDADPYKQISPMGERTKQAVIPMLQKLLEKAGYEPQEAVAITDDLLAIETKIAQVSLGESDAGNPNFFARIYNPISTDELNALSPTFPIVEMLGRFTGAGVDRFILAEPDWLALMNELYVPENLEGFKAMLLCGTLRQVAGLLDQECADLIDEANSIVSGMSVKSVIEDDAFELCSKLLNMSVGRMYAENCVAPETKTDVEAMIADVIAVFKKRLENAAWLGEATRAKAIEKLDNLRVKVAYPDDWSDYDVSDIVFPDGGSLVDDVLAIRMHNRRDMVKKAIEPIDPGKWRGLAPQAINAGYLPSENSINIPAGILGGAYYNPEGAIEENLGGIGMIIGHEITHGFDSTGSQFDKDGNMVNWWTDEDRMAFEKHTQKVNEYFSSIEALPGMYLNGLLTLGETVADLGGMSCVLEIARDIDGFDYRKMFESFARVWVSKMPAEVQQMALTDPHPPGYIRTNATVQQFQQFHDAFDVIQGDGMYIAPESRLSVW